MRKFAYAILLAGLGLALNLEAPPSAIAADLSLKAKKRVVHRHRVKIVRDYDGTPVAVRRFRWVRSHDTAWGWGWGSSWVWGMWFSPARHSPPTGRHHY